MLKVTKSIGIKIFCGSINKHGSYVNLKLFHDLKILCKNSMVIRYSDIAIVIGEKQGYVAYEILSKLLLQIYKGSQFNLHLCEWYSDVTVETSAVSIVFIISVNHQILSVAP